MSVGSLGSRSRGNGAAFLLLQAAFRSWRLAGLIIVTVPLSLVGGLVVALIDGAELSLGSLLGLLAVLGLATRTSIALVTDMQAREGRGEDAREGVVHGVAAERFVPVITTTAALAAFAAARRRAGWPARAGAAASDGAGHALAAWSRRAW